VKRSASGASIYDDEASVFFSEGSAAYYLDETAAEAANAKLAWVARHTPAGATLLDVGANVGHFAAAASRRFDTTAIEPNVHAVRWARERLGAPVEIGSVFDARSDFTGRFQAITLFDVIEHLPDAAGALARCAEWLAPGGRLFITTPDAGSAMARLLGRHWYYVDLDEHIALFTRRNLRALLGRAGFRVEQTRTIGRRYRLSYVEHRLAYLARRAPLLRPAHLAARALALVPRGTVTLNLRDVVGIVARRT
jgi:SAM-dependent methyltransferase